MPAEQPPRVLAALGPRMLQLSAERSWGAHPYFVPVDHTAYARRIMGQGPLLAPEQAVVLEADPTKAREIARRHTVTYCNSVNYGNSMKRLGFTDADLVNGGSDRLVDAIVAWGTLDVVVARVRAHLDAGADHVCVQVLPAVAPTPPPSGPGPLRGIPPVPVPRAEWRELAPALLSL
jgi:probable F420-dependent oxidoreductase